MVNNKGFSLVELLAVIAILGILSGLAITAVSKYQENAKRQAYDTLTESASLAAEQYVMSNPGATEVDFETLVNEGYLENSIDPGTKKDNCTGKVVIKEDDDEDSGAASKLKENTYTVSVCCANYNYTYEYPKGDKHVDKYCKMLPYDITEIKDIKVLNVYPTHSNGTVGNHLKSWMDAYGQGLIKVTPVSIADFNANPNYYLGSAPNWNYDEIVFGFVDCNGNKDLTPASAAAVDQYLSNGGAAIFGHDTITANGCGSHVNFNTLAKHVNLTLHSGVAYKSSTTVKIYREGVFTQYPYKIGNLDTVLSIPRSHVYGQEANGDVWITFTGGDMDSDLPANKIYLSTYGNNAFIQTGHSNGSATADEQKIIANIIFYMVAKQYITE